MKIPRGFTENEEPPPDSALMYRHQCNALSLQLFAHLFEIVLLNFYSNLNFDVVLF